MDDKELELLEALKAQLKKENESIPQNETTEEDELLKQLQLQLEEDNKKLKRALQTNKSTDTSDNDQDVGDENDKSSKGEEMPKSVNLDINEDDKQCEKSPNNKFALVIETIDDTEIAPNLSDFQIGQSHTVPDLSAKMAHENFDNISSHQNSPNLKKHEFLSHIEDGEDCEKEVGMYGDSHHYEQMQEGASSHFNVDESFNEADTAVGFEDPDQIPVLEEEYTGTRIDDQWELLGDGDADDNIPVSYPNALVFNETYQNHLYSMLDMLNEALQDNRYRQQEIDVELIQLEQGKTLNEHGRLHGANTTINGSCDFLPSNPLAGSTRKATVSIFAAPYFKDFNWFTHPDNHDTIRKKAENELDVYLAAPKEWRKNEKRQLFLAVRENALNKRLIGIYQQREHLISKINNRYTDEKLRQELMEALKEVYRGEAIIRSQSDSDLFSNRDEEFDWLTISNQTFDGFFSERSCRLMWRNVLHPSINRGQWKKEEDQVLRILSERLLSDRKCFVNWDDVAAKVGNSRTAFHCLMRFQQRHNNYLDRRRWTCQEDERLKKLVIQCRISKHFVPWPKVAYFMAGRTKDQCYQRYTISLQPHLRKGIFTENEDFVIIIGVKIFGNNWAKIAEFVPNRTPIQIHSRYNTFIKANFQNWTREEDYKLLSLVSEKGNKVWAEIAKHFETRTRSQCRNRFHSIYKMSCLYFPAFTLDKMKYRSQEHVSLQGRRQKILYGNLEKKLCSFLQSKDERSIMHQKGRVDEDKPEYKMINTEKTENIITQGVNESLNASNLQTSDVDETISGSDEENFDLELDDSDSDGSGKLNSVTSSSNIENGIYKANDDRSSIGSSSIAHHAYHVTPDGVQLSKRDLQNFMRSLQGDLPLKAAPWESGGYESLVYQQIDSKGCNGSGANKQYMNPMPIKRMSAFVFKDKRGMLVTKYKGNRGRSGAVRNLHCKQALIDRNLSMYFRSSWPGRVGNVARIYKMAKSHNDQLKQSLAAANYYGQILQVFPYDLQYLADIRPSKYSNAVSYKSLEPLLELYVSRRNEILFHDDSSASSPSYEISNRSSQEKTTFLDLKRAMKIEPKVYSSMHHSARNKELFTSHQQRRTYSRKKEHAHHFNVHTREKKLTKHENGLGIKGKPINKQSCLKSSSKAGFLHFVPPNNQTLVGMRGLLTQLRTLKELVNPNFNGLRLNVDRIVQEGIHYFDPFYGFSEKLLCSSSKNTLSKETISDVAERSTKQSKWSGGGDREIWGQKKLTPSEADKLLVDRFLSIYFWPSQMSVMRPTSYENIFETSDEYSLASNYTELVEGIHRNFTGQTMGANESKYSLLGMGESLAAENPFDASELIEDAKRRTANATVQTPTKAADIHGNGQSHPNQSIDIPFTETNPNQTILVSEDFNSNVTEMDNSNLEFIF